MDVARWIGAWPLLHQREGDAAAFGRAARSAQHATMRPRTREAEHTVASICPYCAVGCGQLVYVKGGKVTQIEGDPASPISRGRLCPKGAATKGYVTSPLREYQVKYRAPYARDWTELPLDEAMDMIADRLVKARAETWEDKTPDGDVVNRTLGIGTLGGATLDNEENYLIKKLFTALGVVSVENQARI
jgi:formate dehydrogenase major subunit